MADSVAGLTIRPNIEAGLSQSQLQELATRLVNKRRELAKLVVDLEHQMVVKDDCSLIDAADAASLQEGRLRAQSMVEQHGKVIKEIDAALRRLETGRYGLSETTGEPIALERLMLIPWARTDMENRDDVDESPTPGCSEDG